MQLFSHKQKPATMQRIHQNSAKYIPIYTKSQKIKPIISCQCLHKILTDSGNSFTDTLSRKFAINTLILWIFTIDKPINFTYIVGNVPGTENHVKTWLVSAKLLLASFKQCFGVIPSLPSINYVALWSVSLQQCYKKPLQVTRCLWYYWLLKFLIVSCNKHIIFIFLLTIINRELAQQAMQALL